MNKIVDSMIGDMNSKKRYYDTENRAKKLPDSYRNTYEEIKQYMWNTAGLITINPLIALVDIFEEASVDGRNVLDVTGKDVAAFADELIKEEKSYKNQQSEKLNSKFNK